MNLGFVEIIKVILIGIIEGVTEWLPISSTGHMLLFDAFVPLDMSEKFKEMFFVVIQLGAIMAVVVIFWRKIFPFETSDKKLRINKDIADMWFKVIAGCLPAAVFGLILDDFLEAHFGNAITISFMLVFYGIAFIFVENRNKRNSPKINSIAKIDYKTAIIIGFFQALSMIPGTSRSGATIIGALLIGVSRTVAAEFTFFLAIPTMLGASALKILKFGFDFSAAEFIVLIIGMIVAFAVSLFVIKFLMDYVRKHDFRIFGYYRIVLGLVVIIVSLIGKNM